MTTGSSREREREYDSQEEKKKAVDYNTGVHDDHLRLEEAKGVLKCKSFSSFQSPLQSQEHFLAPREET